jgi:hypothetical protein
MKRKPWLEAASRTCWATSGEGWEMSITGMWDSAISFRLGFDVLLVKMSSVVMKWRLWKLESNV